jgi:uncharacterized small protein (DUF1192 family)
LAGFTEGPWRRDGFDVVAARLPSEGWQIADCGTSNSPDSAPYNTNLIAAAPALHATCKHLFAEVARLTAEPGKPLANALHQIATAIGTPANVDPLADLPGLVLAVQALAQRSESSAIVAADAVAAERMAIGAWLRARTMVDAPLARSIERGDHIDNDAPPLPSLRDTLLLRDELHRQIKALEAEVARLHAHTEATSPEGIGGTSGSLA